MSKIKNILVTGAGGFIGRETVRLLLNKGYYVTAMITPYSIAPFNPHPNLKILRADILNYSSYSKKLKEIEAIVHLAANKYHPVLSYKVNIIGAKNIKRLVDERMIKGKRIINISTQSTKIKWQGVYGKSKNKADRIIQTPPLLWTTIKPSLVYGRGEGILIETIINFIKELPIIPIIGNGKWKLYPIDVTDVARVIEKTINSPKTIAKVYDLGSTHRITFDQLIILIQRYLGIRKPIIHIPFSIGLLGVYILSKINPNFKISIDNVLGSNQNTNCNPIPIIKDLKIKPISVSFGLKKYLKPSEKNKLKIAIVGLGKMGILHTTILNIIKHVKITALIDQDRSLHKTAQSMGINAVYYSSLEDAIKNHHLDAVYICTPTFSHVKIINICQKNNLPFFVEKPVVSNFTDYKHILNPKYKIVNDFSATGYFWIYKREIQYTKKLLDDKIIGDILEYRINLKHSEVFGSKKGWLFNKKLSGGGVLINPSPHAFSIIQYLLGSSKIQKSKLNYIYNQDIEDAAEVDLITDKRIKGFLNTSWSIPGYPILTIEYQIKGEKGEIDFSNNILTVKRRNNLTKTLRYHQIPFNYPVFNLNPKSYGDSYFLENLFFIENIRQKKRIENNLNFAYQVEYLISQCYEKAK